LTAHGASSSSGDVRVADPGDLFVAENPTFEADVKESE
jgi:hypothetical protein